MNNDDQNLESEFVDFYRREALSHQRVADLMDRGETAKKAYRWKRRAQLLSIVCVALLSIVVARAFFGDRASDDANSPMLAENDQDGAVSEKAAMPRYRFVSVRSHDDRCPHCRNTGDVHRQLLARLNGRPIEFEQLELQDSDRREQTMIRAGELGLSSRIGDRNETAFVFLLPPGGMPIGPFDPSVGATEMARLAENIVDQ